MSGVPEELANISAIQQGLGQGENLHFTSQSGRQELDEISLVLGHHLKQKFTPIPTQPNPITTGIFRHIHTSNYFIFQKAANFAPINLPVLL